MDCVTGQVTRASDIEPETKKIASVFHNFGFRKNNGIHIVVGNYNSSFLALFAAWYLGGFGSCGDIALDAKAIAGQINDTKAKFILCLPETAENVLEAVKLSERSDCTKVFCFGDFPGCENLLTLKNAADAAKSALPEAVDADDVMVDRLVVFWSSGTTGLPKGICHSHFSSWNAFSTFGDELPTHANNVTTTCFFHVGGFFVAFRSILERQSYYHVRRVSNSNQINKKLQSAKSLATQLIGARLFDSTYY